jgi:exopolysaccharide production protein ExoQ
MQNTSASHNEQPARLVVTWVLLIPLLYFSGGLWFQNRLVGYESGAYAPLAHQQTGETAVTSLIAYALLFLPLGSRAIYLTPLLKRNPVFVALPGLAIVSCAWSQSPLDTLKWSFCLLVNTLLAFYLYERFQTNVLIKMTLIVGWICLLLSICLALFFPNYGIQALGGNGAWKGVYGHKNVCAIMTLTLLSGAFFVPSAGVIRLAVKAVYVGLSLFLIFRTQSVAGELAAVFVLLYVIGGVVATRFNSRDATVMVLTFLLLLVIAGSVMVWHFTEMMHLIGKDPTLTGRTGIWGQAAISIAKQPLLGYGYKAFWKGLSGESANILLSTRWAVGEAHNGFINVWLELGAIGLGLVLYSIVKAFRDAVVCFRFRKGCLSAYRWFLCLILIAIVKDLDAEEFMIPNNLIWILYIVACVGLAEGARRINVVESGV